tara:strand:- start:189 stop:1541 length:1353 start_codon:yes stop_codon:yes gene_type:complete
LAITLGPFYFGVYGFIILISNYLSFFNIGIPSSVSVMLIQNKTNDSIVKNILASSIFSIGIISFFLCVIGFLYYFIDYNIFTKFNINRYVPLIIIITILTIFNSLFLGVYRFKNRLFEVGFYQSFKPILILIFLFFGEGERLLFLVLSAHIIAELISLLLFIFRGALPFGGSVLKKYVYEVISKGFYLFLNSTFLLLITLSTRSFISANYSVESFGQFTLSFTIANSFILFLSSFAFIIIPKIMDKLNSDNTNEISHAISIINSNYVTLGHITLYLLIIIFPLFINFFPQWALLENLFNTLCVSILLSINSFAHSSYLMVRNKEKILALITLIALLLNILTSIICIYVFELDIKYIVFCLLFSYFIYGFLCSYFYNKINNCLNYKKIFLDFIPLNLFLPFLMLIVSIFLNNKLYINISFLVLLVSNIRSIKLIFKTLIHITKSPSSIDLK